MTASDMVREFHNTYGVRIQDTPGIPDVDRQRLRFDLLNEELNEYHCAARDGNLIEIADALADMIYIIHGTALEYGIPMDAVLAEVHRSNMSKLGADGKPIRREDGKVLKGTNYSPPDIAGVLGMVRA